MKFGVLIVTLCAICASIGSVFFLRMIKNPPPFELSPEVASALAKGLPVVALESTIITHGLPHPTNIEVARKCEDAIRAAGAVPATIAVLAGVPHVGLTPEQLEDIAIRGPTFVKASRRDLGVIAATGADASTTVAATMIIAAQAGIEVFATGGIGGVHRGAETTFDESADLPEFSRTPVLVVGAGAKSILDIPKTLERLETLGVPVWVHSRDSSEFPAFYHAHSGVTLPQTSLVHTPAVAAAAWRAHRTLLPGSGAFLANPIPVSHALDADWIEGLIQDALHAATEKGISGKDTTPFLLAELAARSEGRTLTANTALVVNNARVAAQVAVELAAM